LCCNGPRCRDTVEAPQAPPGLLLRRRIACIVSERLRRLFASLRGVCAVCLLWKPELTHLTPGRGKAFCASNQRLVPRQLHAPGKELVTLCPCSDPVRLPRSGLQARDRVALLGWIRSGTSPDLSSGQLSSGTLGRARRGALPSLCYPVASAGSCWDHRLALCRSERGAPGGAPRCSDHVLSRSWSELDPRLPAAPSRVAASSQSAIQISVSAYLLAR
jgi:hypothetical protein